MIKRLTWMVMWQNDWMNTLLCCIFLAIFFYAEMLNAPAHTWLRPHTLFRLRSLRSNRVSLSHTHSHAHYKLHKNGQVIVSRLAAALINVVSTNFFQSFLKIPFLTVSHIKRDVITQRTGLIYTRSMYSYGKKVHSEIKIITDTMRYIEQNL